MRGAMLRETVDLCAVLTGSPEWQDARDLRYAVFFAVHHLPYSVMDDRHEAGAFHLVAKEGERVVGYGRLAGLGSGRYEISQMVVDPGRQRKGIGRSLLDSLLRRADQAGAGEITLNARVGAVPFYERAGFIQSGGCFLSQTTGVPHVPMRKRLNRKGQP